MSCKWDLIRFGDLYEIESRNGLSKPSKIRGTGYKMINMGELFDNDRIYDIKMERVPLKETEKNNAKVEVGDLLFARQSLVLEGAGKCSIVLETSELTVFESHLIRVRLKQDKAYPMFYYYFFKSSFSPIKSIVSQCAQAGIRGSELQELDVIYPEMETQIRIADILSKYDELIENNQKQIKLLEEAAQRLYKEWFVDLRFPNFEKCDFIDGLPKGWKKIQLRELGEIITGKTPSTTNSSYYGGNIPFVKIPDMHAGIFSLTTEMKLTDVGANTQKNKFIPKNSIMVSCIGTAGLVNISCENCQTNQQINSIVLNKDYDLYYGYFVCMGLKDILNALGSNGATMTNVNKEKFSNIVIVYPSKKLLVKFNEYVKPFFEKIFALSAQAIKLSESRDRLLPKLMNGEIEV